MHKLLFVFFIFFTVLHAEELSRKEILKKETEQVLQRSLQLAAAFYSLDEDLKEITETILESPLTSESMKELIRSSERRFFVFKYPSDGFQVKGCLSFVPDAAENPLLIFLRGGNRFLGLLHPANDFSCMRDYTVIATTYRGGVSEGIDEFGGDEVNDVEQLMKYFPTLQEKLNMSFSPKRTFILGGSRGGMEMFLFLNKYPQNQVTKAASLSGLLDFEECMAYREDMRDMFIRDFGLVPGENQAEWIARRDPVSNITGIRKDLPILILQGTGDLRVNLQQGLNMTQRLRASGHSVTYMEIEGGDHCLNNVPNRIDLIADWFEN